MWIKILQGHQKVTKGILFFVTNKDLGYLDEWVKVIYFLDMA